MRRGGGSMTVNLPLIREYTNNHNSNHSSSSSITINKLKITYEDLFN